MNVTTKTRIYRSMGREAKLVQHLQTVQVAAKKKTMPKMRLPAIAVWKKVIKGRPRVWWDSVVEKYTIGGNQDEILSI